MDDWLKIIMPVVISFALAFWMDQWREQKRERQQADERAGKIRTLLSQMAAELQRLQKARDAVNDDVTTAGRALEKHIGGLPAFTPNSHLIRRVEDAIAENLDRDEMKNLRQDVEELSRASTKDLTTRFSSN